MSYNWFDDDFDPDLDDFEDANDTVELFVDRVVHLTDIAALVVIEDEEYWLPLSQVEDTNGILFEGGSGIIYISKWLADEKEIDY